MYTKEQLNQIATVLGIDIEDVKGDIVENHSISLDIKKRIKRIEKKIRIRQIRIKLNQQKLDFGIEPHRAAHQRAQIKYDLYDLPLLENEIEEANNELERAMEKLCNELFPGE